MFLGMVSIQEFHEHKKNWRKSCSFSQLTGIWSDYWSWLRHHAPSPHGLGRSSAKHLGMAFQKKKRSHSNTWGLFILGIVVPNEEYPKGLSYRKWIVTRKSDGWFHMIGPSWGTLPFGVWIYIWNDWKLDVQFATGPRNIPVMSYGLDLHEIQPNSR